jgi:hypothetical protein
LLGFYLGDGWISHARRNVYRLRIKTDSAYPAIIEECRAAMQAVVPFNRVNVSRLPYNAVEISSYSMWWPLLFPQHGSGPKHKRRMSSHRGRTRLLNAFRASSYAVSFTRTDAASSTA